MTRDSLLYGFAAGTTHLAVASAAPPVEPYWLKYAVTVVVAMAGLFIPVLLRYIAHRRLIAANAKRDRAARLLDDRAPTEEVDRLIRSAARDEGLARVLDPARKAS